MTANAGFDSSQDGIGRGGMAFVDCTAYVHPQCVPSRAMGEGGSMSMYRLTSYAYNFPLRVPDDGLTSAFFPVHG